MTAYAHVQTAELVTFASLLAMLGKRSRQAIYDLMRRDPTFPRPIQVGSEFSVAWKRCEVLQWIDVQPRASLDGLSAIERRRRNKRAGAVATA